jgi:hypothetical protein
MAEGLRDRNRPLMASQSRVLAVDDDSADVFHDLPERYPTRRGKCGERDSSASSMPKYATRA